MNPKIIEVPIPRDKYPIFIDYSKINGNPIKKFRFLRALIKLADSNEDNVHYETLGLYPEDIELFKQYLKEKYPDQFRVYKKIVNKNDFTGKIICNIDLLIEDLFTVLPSIDKQKPSSDLSLKNSIENKTFMQIEKDEVKPIEMPEKGLVAIFKNPIKKSLNKYLDTFFNTGICQAEIRLFVNDVMKGKNENEIQKVFDYLTIYEEIERIPYRIKTHEVKKEDALGKRDLLLKILKLLRENLEDKSYWDELSLKINENFSPIVESNDDQLMTITDVDGSIKVVSIDEIVNNQNLKIFLAEPSNPDINKKNSVISKFQNKIVFFDFRIYLSSRIFPNDLVLANIGTIEENFVKVIPIKILEKGEALQLIKKGIEVFPSLDFILKNEKYFEFFDNNLR